MNNTLKNIITVSLPTIIVTFIFIELGVRMFKPNTSLYVLTGKNKGTNSMSLWAKNSPFYAYTAIPGMYSIDKSVNSHGFISTPEIELEKDKETTRIVFLGGSSTAGTGFNLPDKQTWPWKTINKLKSETNQKIDFINAALGGYTSFESYGKLWSKLRFYSPDVIVVYHGWNEMYYFGEKANSGYNWKSSFDVSNKVNIQSYAPNWVDPYIKWSQLLSKVRIKLSTPLSLNGEKYIQNKNNKLKKTFNKKSLKVYQQNLRLIRDFCKSNNIDFFICKQASLISKNTKEADKKRCFYYYHGFNHEAHVEAFDSIYKIIDKEIPTENIIDLTSLSSTSNFFEDHIHPSLLGAEKISISVKDSIINNYFKKHE